MANFTQEEIVEALLDFCESTEVTNLAAVAECDGHALLLQFKVSLHKDREEAVAAVEISPEEDIPDGQIH